MNKTKNFALIGAAGYIAPRHMKAIKDTNNTLIAALDRFDSVGIIDSFFPDASFFTEPERFDRHLDRLRRIGNGDAIDYVSICSPNYLHDAHIRLALRNQAHAICEKPIVLNPWNVDFLQELEKERGKNIYNILQLRYHPSIVELKKEVEKSPKDKIYDIDLTYITSRGKWYHISWKGDYEKSGGIATNIGIHFFDMLAWIFGDVKINTVHLREKNRAAGYLELNKARVRWLLSLDENDIPKEIRDKGLRTYRTIEVEGENIEFSGGFTDLHTVSYKEILGGRGWRIGEAKRCVEIAQQIRNTRPIGLRGDYHPFIKKINN